MDEVAPLAYLNGEFLPLSQACVPVLDRGFLFGDGVYEVFPAFNRHLFRLEPHLRRLEHSLTRIRIQPPLDDTQWRTILEHLLESVAGPDQSVYLQITRGVAATRNHGFDPAMQPTVFATASPVKPRDPALAARGGSAITLPDPRWAWCDIKATTLLANVLLRQQAEEAGADEAILLRDGWANEGSASNLFIVRDGVLITPPKGPMLLPGITRDLILELATHHGLPHREECIQQGWLPEAEEIWVTSSVREILPITRLDGKPVGTGHPGDYWRRMQSLYQDYKQALRAP